MQALSPGSLAVRPSPDHRSTRTYTFDSVYGPEATQQEVFQDVVEPLIEEVFCLSPREFMSDFSFL